MIAQTVFLNLYPYGISINKICIISAHPKRRNNGITKRKVLRKEG